MPVRWVNAAGRCLLRARLCQLGNGANKATWRLPGSCSTIRVSRKGEARLLPAAWLRPRGWECLCSEVRSQGQDAGAAKGGAGHLQTPGLGLPLLAKLPAHQSQLCSSVAVAVTVVSTQTGGWSPPTTVRSLYHQSHHPFRWWLLAQPVNQVVVKRDNRAKNEVFVYKNPLCEALQT